MNVRLRGVTIIDPGSQHHGEKTDLHIYDGKISFVDRSVDFDQEIGMDGLCVSPGWFDLRASIPDPGHEYKEDLFSGAACAEAGGFSDVVVLPNTEPVIQSKNDIRYVTTRYTEGPVRLHAAGAVTINTAGESLTEMLDMHAAGAIAFTDGEKPIWNSDILLKSLQYLSQVNGVLMSRPSDKYLSLFGQMHEGKISTMLGMKGIPALAEEIIIRRDLQLLRYAGGRLHFSNISTSGGLTLIKEAKQEGLAVTCDVAVAQLAFTEDALLSFDTNYKADPPYRSQKDRQALLEGVVNGSVDAVVSAHTPQDEESKKCEFDLSSPGIISLQTTFPMLLGQLGSDQLEVIVERLAHGPRKVLGMESLSIKEDSSACLTLFNPETKWVFDSTANLSKSQNSPLLGQELTGKALGVINGNKTYFDQAILIQHHD
ncbi:dihydroorotase family protein [Roseivirga sp. BDSF3-8]|uniref:dihydroorotase n=1 Tax=Roseivirga sp. BDSF3-8 TaxID=3241598 RepID=UPI003531A5D0